MSRNFVVTLVMIVVLLVGGWWLLTQSQQTATPQTPARTTPTQIPSSPATEATEEAMTEGGKEIKVSGTEFAFAPKILSVKRGEKVKITFTNDGKFPHNLTVDELNIATKTIGAGQTDTLEFTAEKDGTFAMYCSVGNHRQQGMEGDVSVQ